VKKIKSFLDRIYFKRHLSVKEKYYAILSSIFAIYVYLIVSKLPSPDNHFSICIFKNLTGYPCAACGTTRGLKYLVRGDFYEALMMNPLSYFSVIVSVMLVFWIIVDLIKKQETLFSFIDRKIPVPIVLLVIILTALNWYWNIVKGL
jgi:TctA family transporter